MSTADPVALGWGLRARIATAKKRASYWLRLQRLRFDRLLQPRRRLMASICGNFPIYSQTFVYQELVQLQKRGFEVRHAYSFRLPRSDLHDAFALLWPRRRLLVHDYDRHRQDFEFYRKRSPAKVDQLVHLVAEAAGMTPEVVMHHHDFVRGFTFTRMVEAWRPHWLHSYFFYERSLYSLIAGFMLDTPRGISAYADHSLQDYEFKLVPLQLQLCDVVVATSSRIKQELLGLAPGIDADKIIVKPNAIDGQHFPRTDRAVPSDGQPWRLVCVARIEPKKGQIYLAQALHILRTERGHNVELHLIGEPDRDAASQQYASDLKSEADARQLSGTLHFEGRKPQTEVRRFLALGHVFIAPFVETATGDKDGIPTALLEAMATGAAVVVTNAGSMLEVVTDGLDGLVVPQRDAGALADAIERLLTDGDLRRRLSTAAAATVQQRFDVSVCESRLHQRIDVVLATRAQQLR